MIIHHITSGDGHELRGAAWDEVPLNDRSDKKRQTAITPKARGCLL